MLAVIVFSPHQINHLDFFFTPTKTSNYIIIIIIIIIFFSFYQILYE